eukprot:TRINITY_DN3316_c0_g1_i1.p1 TRINITY_DN3316_c0_g1~~TRINITY_DN3316_c0_g1_i1.p1  ORF type:complete len:562 (-),score=102.52 TRINITY_DN3316_c0_g1_i1:56-1711(-)
MSTKIEITPLRFNKPSHTRPQRSKTDRTNYRKEKALEEYIQVTTTLNISANRALDDRRRFIRPKSARKPSLNSVVEAFSPPKRRGTVSGIDSRCWTQREPDRIYSARSSLVVDVSEAMIGVVGRENTGKTTLVHLLATGKIIEGLDYERSKVIPIEKSDFISAQTSIVDFSNDTMFKLDTHKKRYLNINCFICVFGLDDKNSFEDIKGVVSTLKEYRDSEIILVGNKMDLPRKVSYKEASSFASLNSIVYVEVSCTEHDNILELETFMYKLSEASARKLSARKATEKSDSSQNPFPMIEKILKSELSINIEKFTYFTRCLPEYPENLDLLLTKQFLIVLRDGILTSFSLENGELVNSIEDYDPKGITIHESQLYFINNCSILIYNLNLQNKVEEIDLEEKIISFSIIKGSLYIATESGKIILVDSEDYKPSTLLNTRREIRYIRSSSVYMVILFEESIEIYNISDMDLQATITLPQNFNPIYLSRIHFESKIYINSQSGSLEIDIVNKVIDTEDHIKIGKLERCASKLSRRMWAHMKIKGNQLLITLTPVQ